MPEPEPINWAALNKPGSSEAIGGPRGYQGSEATAIHPWKCPACGEEQIGRLGDGCTSCGSGKGARHVGVDPRPVKPVALPPQRAGATGMLTLGPLPAALSPRVDAAFIAWMQQAGSEIGPLPAFRAGWDAAMQLSGSPGGGSVNTPDAGDIPADRSLDRAVEDAGSTPVPGTPFAPEQKQVRTIIAGLTFFKDQILPESQEEVLSGEWLSADELQQVIDQLKGTL